MKSIFFLILITLLSFQVVVANEFDPTLYLEEESNQDTTDEKVEEEFDPNLYIVNQAEETSNNQVEEEFNPVIYTEENLEETSTNEPVVIKEDSSPEIEVPQGEVVYIDTTAEVNQNNSQSPLLIIGFGVAVISLMLIVLLYAIHYYREKHHLK